MAAFASLELFEVNILRGRGGCVANKYESQNGGYKTSSIFLVLIKALPRQDKDFTCVI